MSLLDRISLDPAVRFGKPCVRGTRIAVGDVLGYLAGGMSEDRLLTDFPNLYADMSANSCNNFLNRDPEFAAGFLDRHQDKLMFGSDCPCLDGRGGGTAANRCIARATLTALKNLASPAVFSKITWENANRLLTLPRP